MDNDYSIWSQICLSFIYHKMKDLGMSKKVLDSFQDLISFRTKSFIKFTYSKQKELAEEYEEHFQLQKEKQQSLKNVLDTSGEFSKFEKIFQWAKAYFKLMDDMSFREEESSYIKTESPLLGKVQDFGSYSKEKMKKYGYHKEGVHEYVHSVGIYNPFRDL